MTTPKKTTATKQLQNIILTTGKALHDGMAKATTLHLLVLDEIGESSDVKKCKQRPVAEWFRFFVTMMNRLDGFEWPVVCDKDAKNNGDLIGYRTIMRKPSQYSKNAVYAATYFNRLQAFINVAKKIEVVKGKGKKQSSRAHVVTADAITKRLDALFDCITQDEEGKLDGIAVTHLQRFAKRLGVIGYKQGNEVKTGSVDRAKS